MNQNIQIHQEWLKILGKGMVTLPKKWRDELGLETGDIVRAKKQGNSLIIEPLDQEKVPFRVYTDKEIEAFLLDDAL
jgi:AbrB family looped-hinge helix DNA binding protein